MQSVIVDDTLKYSHTLNFVKHLVRVSYAHYDIFVRESVLSNVNCSYIVQDSYWPELILLTIFVPISAVIGKHH